MNEDNVCEFGFCLSGLARRGPLGRTALTKEVKEGRLKAKKYGNKTIVLPEDFRRFLDALPDAPVKTA